MQFAAHQSFHLRDGWLTKGLSALKDNPDIFTSDFPTDELGIGMNMVKSLRYWLYASGLTSETLVKGSTSRQIEITPFGKVIMKQDPYFEDVTTLWFLHINLVSNEDHATTLYWLFNEAPFGSRFDNRLAVQMLSDWIKSKTKRIFSPNSLDKDFKVITRMYSDRQAQGRHLPPEESLESPFALLRLLSIYERSGEWSVKVGSKPLSPYILSYAIQTYADKVMIDLSSDISLKFPILLEDKISPGRVLAMDSESLYKAIQSLEKFCPREYSFVRTAGLNNLSFTKELPVKVVKEYYDNASIRSYEQELANV